MWTEKQTNAFYTGVGKRLRAVRTAQGASQRDVMRILGISRSAVGGFETRAHRRIAFHYLAQLATAWNVPVASFLPSLPTAK